MAESGGDRTERATPRRREEARKHGQVVLSPEVAPVAVLFAVCAVAAWGGPLALERSRLVLRAWLAGLGTAAAHDGLPWPLVGHAVLELGSLLLPLCLVTAVVGAGAVIAQVGWVANPGLLAPDPGRLSPANGLKRIFSLNGAVNFVKAVVKIGIVGWIAYRVLRRTGGEALVATDMSIEALFGFTGTGLRRLLLAMAAALGVLGVLDYLWQRWRYEQTLKMSRHEVREEQKESEGDPQVKMRFRRAHREIAKRRMLADVARADVVLTNPIHVAVALRYRAGEMTAPQVLAKGAGELAEKVKEAARRAGVPIVERRALARALFKAVAVGAEITPALYRAVAEILAYIYSLRATAAGEAR